MKHCEQKKSIVVLLVSVIQSMNAMQTGNPVQSSLLFELPEHQNFFEKEPSPRYIKMVEARKALGKQLPLASCEYHKTLILRQMIDNFTAYKAGAASFVDHIESPYTPALAKKSSTKKKGISRLICCVCLIPDNN